MGGTFLNSDKRVFVEGIHPGVWTHICHLITRDFYILYVDGQKIYTWKESRTFSLVLNGSLVLGQEQDSLGGGFDKTQAFIGDLSQVSLWSRVLSSGEVARLAACEDSGHGDVFASDEIQLEEKGSITTTWMPLEDLCRPPIKSQFFFLPETRLFSEARAVCEAFNGSLVTPLSPAESQHLLEMWQSFGASCSVTGRIKVWLGLTDEAEEGVWRDITTNQLVEYQNFEPNRVGGGRVYNCATMDGKGTWLDSPCHATMKVCTACRWAQSSFMRLQGLCFAKEHQARVYVSSGHVDGRPFFVGYYSTLLRWAAASRAWMLVQLSDNSTLATTESVVVASYPVGKHRWKLGEELCGKAAGAFITLSLSPCDDSQFMCDSGHCIPRDQRCNLLYECADGSDEHHCSKVEVEGEYLKQLSPVGPGGAALLLLAALKLTRVANVDEINMAVNLDFELSLEWAENRAKLRHLSAHAEPTTISKEDAAKLWQPDYHLTNLQGGKATLLAATLAATSANNATLPSFNNLNTDVFYPGAANTVLLMHQYTADVICYFTFWFYPLDVQRCYINVSLPGAHRDRVLFSLDGATMQYTGVKDLALYTVVNAEVSPHSTAHLIMFQVDLQRRPGAVVLSTFLPSLLVLVVSWATLFVRQEAINARAIMSLTSLLVLFTLFTNFSNTLPKTAEVKLIDLWFFSIIAILFVNILVHITIPDRPPEPQPHLKTVVKRVRPLEASPAEYSVQHPLPQDTSLRLLVLYRCLCLPVLCVVINVAFWLLVFFKLEFK
ncbi:uncharacterized protein LOC123508957 isoform X2 [Portunus trituberculatus]|nr:uncharacterized protein LOC123508957 isoform X2 [Portunus trituberculatus]